MGSGSHRDDIVGDEFLDAFHTQGMEDRTTMRPRLSDFSVCFIIVMWILLVRVTSQNFKFWGVTKIH
jgi:hypothetical protein